jgi:organic radical activating enzyme
MDDKPIDNNQMCPAIFTGLVFDTDKSVKPCCAYGDHHGFSPRNPRLESSDIINNNDFGVMSDTYQLKDILESKERKTLQQQARNNEPSPGCEVCDRRYRSRPGRSQKTTWLTPPDQGGLKGFHDGWETNITVIEINHSNTCNLSCAPCNSFFSSSWLKYEEMIADPLPWADRHSKRPPTKPFDIVSHLKEIDLTKLKTLVLKGGEPMMNPDLLPLLQYFSDINILSNLTISITSNGTILNKEMESVKQLLDKCKNVLITLSVDGVGFVGTYIRYSPQQFAKIENIEAFIQSFTEHKNTRFILFPTIQVYNVFSLDKLVDWWDIMVQKYKHTCSKPLSNSDGLYIGSVPRGYVELNHFVLGPNYLSVAALQPATIKNIVQYYKNKNDERYDKLIASLEKIRYLGDKIHNEMVKYTLEMDRIKNQNVFSCIPQLVDEMIIR